MGLHLTTLLTGAALGTLLTFITKDEALRKSMERFLDGLAEGLKARLDQFTQGKSGSKMGEEENPSRTASAVSKRRRPRKTAK